MKKIALGGLIGGLLYGINGLVAMGRISFEFKHLLFFILCGAVIGFCFTETKFEKNLKKKK